MANLLQRITRSEPAAPADQPPAASEPPTTEVAPPAETAPPAGSSPPTESSPPAPSWRVRGRLRRRLRYLRAAREVALRDLGGLVFDLHRFERERPDLVKAKLESLGELDRERRELEIALGDPRETDVLRVPGLASCPSCGELMPSAARFCPSCGAEAR
jgi:hypothetical protein